jgi:hypothetical protein
VALDDEDLVALPREGAGNRQTDDTGADYN